ncbi:MAG: glycosyltransferase [Anaerolineales bacterium]
MIHGYYGEIFPYTVVVFLAVALLIAILNYCSIRRFDQFPAATNFPRVSILVPARNEERNIKNCVESLLAQQYPDFEVLVLNDHSTDQTGTILERISTHDPRLEVWDGDALPSGWLGKHWACHQLSQRASGELILFTDADTRHEPDALRDSVSALIAQNADLLTGFPREEMRTWGEKLTVPILAFGIMCFFPILLAEKLSLPAFSVTIGQFMLFRRSAFEAVGGYKAIRDHAVDDIKLGHNIISQGFHWQFLDATRHVTCRMYHGFSNAVDGFTRTMFAAFDHHLFLYGIGWSWIAISYLFPLCALFNVFSGPLNFPISLAMIAITEALLMICLTYRRFRIPGYLVLLYPLSLLIFTWIAFRSLVYSITGYQSWKNREMPCPKFKL